MSNSAVLKKTSEPGSKVNFTPVSSPRENSIEGGELHEHGVDDEPAIDDAGDRRGVEQGEQIATP